MRERQRVPSTRQKRGTRTLLNSLLQKVQLRDRQQVIQTTLQKAFKGLHRRCELSVKVTSGAQSNERKFFISIFNRPAITLTLDETSLVAFSAINMLEMQITLHGLEEYLLLQIWQVCMHQVADEANMLGLASGSAAGSKLWRPNFFIMEGVIRTAKLPFRCSVYCVGSDISSSYLEFVYLQKRVKVPLATPDNVAQWRTLRGDIQDALLTAKNAVNPNEDWSEVLGL
ncbi:hypothetical protein DFS34DRAFT_271251 [Phlyctochytrium arcticum]|nr:hypothetical protein DFS34DRAFT_271251 [Phlyctochytrium arcticum]